MLVSVKCATTDCLIVFLFGIHDVFAEELHHFSIATDKCRITSTIYKHLVISQYRLLYSWFFLFLGFIHQHVFSL